MFRKFNSIEQLHTVSKEALKYGKTGDIVFEARIKIHGTNAAVIISPNDKENYVTIKAQKRTGLITPDNDNFGFAQWVEDNKCQWLRWYENFLKEQPDAKGQVLYIFGEWAGQGIQKEDAVSKAPKCFYVFDIVSADEKHYVYRDQFFMNVWYIPVFKEYTLNFFNQEVMNKFVEEVTKDIESIGICDPFIKQIHGIEGNGEGLVFTPQHGKDYSLMFKLKTSAHAENKRIDKQTIAYTPEVVAEIQQFVDKYATEPRYHQALTELNIRDTFSIKDTGRFIGWVCKDVNKECQAELEVSGLDWKDIAAVLTQKARVWFLGKVK